MPTYTVPSSADDKNAILIYVWTDTGPSTNTHGIGNVGGQAGYHSWLRFTGVNIAQGTTITTALLKLNNNNAGNGSSGSAGKIKVHCEAADNSTMPADASAADGRTLTTGTALTPSYTTGIYSLDITSEVQAVIDRAGWVSGNALSVFAKDDASATNQAIYHKDYGAGSSVAAQIEITISGGGGSAPFRRRSTRFFRQRF